MTLCRRLCVFFYRLPIILTRQSLFRSILFFFSSVRLCSVLFGCQRTLSVCLSSKCTIYIFTTHKHILHIQKVLFHNQTDVLLTRPAQLNFFFLSVGRHKNIERHKQKLKFLNIYCLFSHTEAERTSQTDDKGIFSATNHLTNL